MSKHLVTAHIVVDAEDWEEAEQYVRAIGNLLGPASECYVTSAKWEEELEDDE